MKEFKLKTSIEISFDHNQDNWNDLTYEILVKEKKNIEISELNISKRTKKYKMQDASTKLF